jgi:DNA-directed RNA polymerase subunit RPC12/RpoP
MKFKCAECGEKFESTKAEFCLECGSFDVDINTDHMYMGCWYEAICKDKPIHCKNCKFNPKLF